MTDREETGSPSRLRRVVATLLIAVAVLGAWDVITDTPQAWTTGHIAIEVASILLGAVAAILLWSRWNKAEQSLMGVRAMLAERQVERDHWRARVHTVLRGLGEAMDEQFATWSLTRAEREAAMFLLKGYSHKEIANLTQRSERTIRQHAVSVYRKAGLGGRAELAAFFFEDMLLPQGDASDESGS